jgi:hypothetical protein
MLDGPISVSSSSTLVNTFSIFVMQRDFTHPRVLDDPISIAHPKHIHCACCYAYTRGVDTFFKTLAKLASRPAFSLAKTDRKQLGTNIESVSERGKIPR